MNKPFVFVGSGLGYLWLLIWTTVVSIITVGLFFPWAKYIVMMQVLDTTPLKDITLAKRVSIQLQMTDASLRSRDRVVRSTEKGSLGEAMEFASIWLERALSGKM